MALNINKHIKKLQEYTNTIIVKTDEKNNCSINTFVNILYLFHKIQIEHFELNLQQKVLLQQYDIYMQQQQQQQKQQIQQLEKQLQQHQQQQYLQTMKQQTRYDVNSSIGIKQQQQQQLVTNKQHENTFYQFKELEKRYYAVNDIILNKLEKDFGVVEGNTIRNNIEKYQNEYMILETKYNESPNNENIIKQIDKLIVEFEMYVNNLLVNKDKRQQQTQQYTQTSKFTKQTPVKTNDDTVINDAHKLFLESIETFRKEESAETQLNHSGTIKLLIEDEKKIYTKYNGFNKDEIMEGYKLLMSRLYMMYDDIKNNKYKLNISNIGPTNNQRDSDKELDNIIKEIHKTFTKYIDSYNNEVSNNIKKEYNKRITDINSEGIQLFSSYYNGGDKTTIISKLYQLLDDLSAIVTYLTTG